MHVVPAPPHEVAHVPLVVELPVLAQAPEQQAGLPVHVAPGGAQEGPSGPESGGGLMQQELSCCPQLFKQLPEHPVLMQQVPLAVQTAPLEQVHAWGTPHESATETLHAFPQLLVGVQHVLLLGAHSWPATQLQAWGTPHESATEPLHWLPQLFVGEQHLPADVHSWPFAHPPTHWIISPQLSGTVAPPHRPLQGDTGEQHMLW